MKISYILAITLVALSAAMTPTAIETATLHRGYIAYGGEYLLIPLGGLLAYVLLEAAAGLDRLMAERKRRKEGCRNEKVPGISHKADASGADGS